MITGAYMPLGAGAGKYKSQIMITGAYMPLGAGAGKYKSLGLKMPGRICDYGLQHPSALCHQRVDVVFITIKTKGVVK